jgi:hypothetical protein
MVNIQYLGSKLKVTFYIGDEDIAYSFIADRAELLEYYETKSLIVPLGYDLQNIRFPRCSGRKIVVDSSSLLSTLHISQVIDSELLFTFTKSDIREFFKYNKFLKVNVDIYALSEYTSLITHLSSDQAVIMDIEPYPFEDLCKVRIKCNDLEISNEKLKV